MLGVCLVIVLFPWNYNFKEAGNLRALQGAEVVGYQVVQLYQEAMKVRVAQQLPTQPTSSSFSRVPASVKSQNTLDLSSIRVTGTMGQDPWGRAYHYRFINLDQKNVQILVWSTGPNGSVETPELDDGEDYTLNHVPAYRGDDLGIVISAAH